MKTIKKSLRETLFFVTSLPVAVILFSVTALALGNNLFLPLAVILALGLLGVMEEVAKFEINRTNKILRTDFRISSTWFKHPFLSWDGAKERVTSLRNWMAVGYVFSSFGIALVSAADVAVILIGALSLLISTSAFGLAGLEHSVVLPEAGEMELVTLRFTDAASLQVQISSAFQDLVIRLDFDSPLSVTVSALAMLLGLWLIPRISRWQVRLVDGLLSGTYLPRIESQMSLLSRQRKVSERQVHAAMENVETRESIQALSKREREILSLMAQGKSNYAIAKELYIAHGSVEKHISNILAKLELPLEESTHRRVLAVLKYLGLES